MLPQYFAVFERAGEHSEDQIRFIIIRRSVDPPIDEFWGRDLNHHTTSSFREGRYPYFTVLTRTDCDRLLEKWRQNWRSDRAETYAMRDAALSQQAVTYYAQLDYGRTKANPSGVVRSVHLQNGGRMDEEIDADLEWWPTEFLRMYARGHMDTDFEEISIEEGEAIVRRWRANGNRLS